MIDSLQIKKIDGSKARYQETTWSNKIFMKARKECEWKEEKLNIGF